MADVTYFELKQGATGATFVVTLKDANGPADLAGHTECRFVARRAGGVAVINDATCVINPDQITFRGDVSYTFDDTTANIPTGEYNMEFQSKDADSKWHIFPTNRFQPYGKLIVEKALNIPT